MRAGAPPMRLPVVPDRSLLTAQAAAQAVKGILAAGKHAKRFGGLDVHGARVLATLLRLYAELGEPPSTAWVADSAGPPEEETGRLLVELFHRDLALQGEGLAVRGAYPFTQAVTGHSVTFLRTGRSLNTMCIIDALGAGALCRDATVVRSSCRECGISVLVRVGDHGASVRSVEPASPVVWAGFRANTGSAATSVCKELLPFCSTQHLDRWKASRPHSDGRALTMEEALQVGRAFFADRALWGRD